MSRMGKRRFRVCRNFWLEFIVWDDALDECRGGPFGSKRAAKRCAAAWEAKP